MFEVKPIDIKTRKDVINLINEQWGGPVIVTKGIIHYAGYLPGFVAVEDDKLKGLITTNDNTHAIRFYQRRGFNFTGLYINAIQESRKIKPQIPLLGMDDIPIMHEIEFEKNL